MAQTGYTPLQIYSSSTGGAAPSAGNLANSTLGSELAINITDGKLFYKDNAGVVQVIAWKTTPTTAGGTGLTSYTAGDLLYYATGTALSKLAIGTSGQWLGSSGTAPQWNSPAALTKTDDTNVTLTLGGSASTALLNAASITVGWTGTLATTRGGTGLSSFTSGGVVYASSTSALTTGSALNFNGNALGINTAANSAYQIRLDAASPLFGMMVSGTQAFTIGANSGGGASFYYGAGNVTSGTIAADWTITNGNLVIGTSGKGIDFSATPGTGTSELLDDYEEGDWTPTPSGITVNSGTPVYSGSYTKVGRLVTVNWNMSGGNITTVAGTSKFTNLPFANVSGYSWGIFGNQLSFANGPMESGPSTNLQLYASITGSYFAGTITYMAAT